MRPSLPLSTPRSEPEPTAARPSLRQRLRLAGHPTPVDCVVLALLGLGVFLRAHAFGFPSTFLFDEHHFVENARNYRLHQPDWNDHPPLGKLFIAASMALLGDNPVGWRAPALLCGAIVVVAGGVAVARLFRSRASGLIAAALLAADGFLISYSRAGLLDGYLTACAVLSLLLASVPFTPGTALAAGLLGGIACSIKFSGVAVLAPLLLALATASLPWRRAVGLASTVVVIVLVTYVASFMVGLRLARQPASALDVLRETQRLVAHHAALTDMKNPWTSSWPTWLLPGRPLMLARVSQPGSVRVLTSLGNLAIWWAAMATALTLAWAILVRGLAATLASAAAAPRPAALSDADPSPGALLDEHGRAIVLVLSTALAFLAPWVLTRRDSYIYHFLPSYAALVLLLGGALGWCALRRPSWVLHFLLLVLVVAAFYAPVWSFLPLDARGVTYRLFLGSWR